MPGWEDNPNLNASEVIAFGYQFTGDRPQTIGQFPMPDPDQRVQNFFDASDGTNISFSFLIGQFPE